LKRLALSASLWIALLQSAHAAPRQTPAALAAKVQEKPGAELPADLSFTTAQAAPLSLGDLRSRNLPLLLVLAYARCAMLCSWVLQGVSSALALLPDMQPGRDFLPVVVSIDPRESPATAAAKQAVLLERLQFPGQPERFPFLVGSEEHVQALAGAWASGTPGMRAPSNTRTRLWSSS
jgi:protein SCO1/2